MTIAEIEKGDEKKKEKKKKSEKELQRKQVSFGTFQEDFSSHVNFQSAVIATSRLCYDISVPKIDRYETL